MLNLSNLLFIKKSSFYRSGATRQYRHYSVFNSLNEFESHPFGPVKHNILFRLWHSQSKKIVLPLKNALFSHFIIPFSSIAQLTSSQELTIHDFWIVGFCISWLFIFAYVFIYLSLKIKRIMARLIAIAISQGFDFYLLTLRLFYFLTALNLIFLSLTIWIFIENEYSFVITVVSQDVLGQYALPHDSHRFVGLMASVVEDTKSASQPAVNPESVDLFLNTVGTDGHAISNFYISFSEWRQTLSPIVQERATWDEDFYHDLLQVYYVKNVILNPDELSYLVQDDRDLESYIEYRIHKMKSFYNEAPFETSVMSHFHPYYTPMAVLGIGLLLIYSISCLAEITWGTPPVPPLDFSPVTTPGVSPINSPHFHGSYIGSYFNSTLHCGYPTYAPWGPNPDFLKFFNIDIIFGETK